MDGPGTTPSTQRALIEIRDVQKIYEMGAERVAALRGVSLDITKGEFVAVMGSSGSGKSTLMNILGCLDRPTSGSYHLEGREVSRLSRGELAEVRNRSLGFVFQNFNLLARTSALENVELPLVYGGVATRERQARAKEALTRVGLGNRLDHRPSQLSGGQQQRVAIARALVNAPSILLCDEPTGNLDTRTSREIMAFFRELNRDGLTVILVTHDLAVSRQADRSLVLIDGEVVVDTTNADEAAHALHQRTSLDDPPETPA